MKAPLSQGCGSHRRYCPILLLRVTGTQVNILTRTRLCTEVQILTTTSLYWCKSTNADANTHATAFKDVSKAVNKIKANQMAGGLPLIESIPEVDAA